MNANDVTPLEAALLVRFQKHQPDLPPPTDLLVISREHTGVGRFTELRKAAGGAFAVGPDGKRIVHSLPAEIQMDDVEAPGLGAVLFVELGDVTLELFTYSGEWDGVERTWKIEDAE